MRIVSYEESDTVYGVTVYIEPEDILNKLPDKDKSRFEKCVLADVKKMSDGTVNISCLLFENADEKIDEQEVKYLGSIMMRGEL